MTLHTTSLRAEPNLFADKQRRGNLLAVSIKKLVLGFTNRQFL